MAPAPISDPSPAALPAGYTQAAILHAVLSSLIGEVDALKPGNVHRFAGGHGMHYEEFISSAEASVEPLCEPGARPGRRVLKAVEATHKAVGANTNLGILLLYAPILKACETSVGPAALHESLVQVLGALHKNDARDVFTAIRLAQPGGLGKSDRHDVNRPPDCTLLEAMQEAQDRDRVARQYVSGFTEIWTLGLPWFREFRGRWNSVEWATVGCYLRFLAEYPDSHIQRKFGADVAQQVRRRSAEVLKRFEKKKEPGSAVSMLLEYDKELKDTGINPGTSADLTAASLLLYQLGV